MIGRQVRIRPGRRAQNVQLTELRHLRSDQRRVGARFAHPPGALIAQREYRWSRPSRDIRPIGDRLLDLNGLFATEQRDLCASGISHRGQTASQRAQRFCAREGPNHHACDLR